MSDPNPEEDDEDVNVGLQYQHTICIGKTFDMICGIHADIFNQNRYMINGVTLKIRMSISKDKFVLMGTENVEYMIEILSAKLLMRKLKIAPSLALAHEINMTKKQCQTSSNQGGSEGFHLLIGKKRFTHDNLFQGKELTHTREIP